MTMGRKLFRMIFAATYVGFICFMYLFATRVTPPDIDYFIKDTQEQTAALTATVHEYRSAMNAKRAEKEKEKEKEKAGDSNEDALLADAADADTADTGETMLESNSIDLTYYAQKDSRWKDAIYGTDNTIGRYGCGPTTLAMMLSTLTDNEITPIEAAKWAYDNGHFCNNSGSYHSIIPKGAEKFGLQSKSLVRPTKEEIFAEIESGKLVIVLMNEGTFTSDGHFLILRGVTEDGKLLIADSQSLENSEQVWEPDIFINEAKYAASHGGPFWAVGR